MTLLHCCSEVLYLEIFLCVSVPLSFLLQLAVFEDWVEKCITLEVERAIQRDRSVKTWKEVVDKDMNALHVKLRVMLYGRS